MRSNVASRDFTKGSGIKFLKSKYLKKIIEYKNLKPFFERIKNILNLKTVESILESVNTQLE